MTYCFTEYCEESKFHKKSAIFIRGSENANFSSTGKETQKGCSWIAPGYTPEDICKMDQQTCGGGFYCRYCTTDKCNNEPLGDDGAVNANAIEMDAPL
jgi:hypothetical protein